MTVPSPRFPWWLRAIDSAGDGARRLGALRHLLDPDALLAEAAAAEGHDRFGDGTEAMLRIFCASLLADARLAFHGRIHLHGLASTALRVRLRLEAARARDPSIDRPPRRPPLIVCGLPRSGTTLLHRLLTLADDARPLVFWELTEPLPGRGPDRRRQEAERKLRRLQRLVPLSLDAQHLVRADLPDEDGHLLKPSFASSLLYQAPALTWLDHLLRDDLAIAYANWRALLVLLEAPERRLVLKDPFHARRVARIVDLIPDAMIVRTHRDPAEVVPSFHKLTMTMHSVTCTSLDLPRIVAANTRWLESITDACTAPLGDAAAARVVDVDYRALLRDPVGTARSIHARFDLPWTDALEARARAFLPTHRQRGHGDNPYDPADYGQPVAALHERFAAYRRAFGLDRE